jgi:hypothetical protein
VGFQNNVEPQTEQKPRRTVSDDRYQATDSPPSMRRALRRTFTAIR